MYLSSISGLIPLLREKAIWDIRVKEPCEHLAYYHYRKEGVDYYFFTNEDIYRDVRTEIEFTDPRDAIQYDAMKDQRYLADQTRDADGICHVRLLLKPYESTFIVFGETAETKPYNWEEIDLEYIEIPEDGWEISVRGYEPGSDFVNTPYRCLGNLTAPGRMPDFSGTIRYETYFEQLRVDRTLLMLGEVYESVRVLINGILIGEKICPPYSFEIPVDVVRNGKSKLTIEVVNTLAKAHHDNSFDRFWVQDPSSHISQLGVKTEARFPKIKKENDYHLLFYISFNDMSIYHIMIDRLTLLQYN